MKLILSNYNNLTQRIVTALIGVAIILTAITWNAWAYFGVFLFLTIFSQLEFYKLIKIHGIVPLRILGTMAGALIFTLTFLIEKMVLHQNWYFGIFPLVSIIYFIKLYKKNETRPFTNIAFTFLGIIYVAVPFSLINVIAFIKGPYNYEPLIGMLFLLWASDTGAYFAGTKFGKTKLFERVSPKKSWEGFLGGAALSLLFAYGFSVYFPQYSWVEWSIISAIIIIAGTYGDLVESLFKRSMEIKDSGRALVGHGGFLDRFDGLLLSVPFILMFLKLI
ncbi:MAG: phosphatidate cytidylyltransferase [Cyclobacteriaceae bacterium]